MRAPLRDAPKSSDAALTQIVGLGASAGGLEALEQFFSHVLPPISGLAYIVVQHLDPTLLARLGGSALTTVGALQLAAGRGGPRSVHACVKRDPGGPHFLVAFLDVAEQAEESTR